MHEGTLAELQQRTGHKTLTEMFLSGLAKSGSSQELAV
jgi:hypothetical protein